MDEHMEDIGATLQSVVCGLHMCMMFSVPYVQILHTCVCYGSDSRGY